MDIEQARFNMIEQQIRPWEVLDASVLAVLGKVRREDFVPEAYKDLAFADIQIPIAQDQVMMEPKVEARMVQELNIDPHDMVLEIGTGSGYVTAMLGSLAAHVTSVEIHKELSEAASSRLSQSGVSNFSLVVEDAAAGYGDADQFDAILLSGSVPSVPQKFFDALKEGGRLVAVVGTGPVMEAIRYEKSAGEITSQSLFDTVLPPLENVVVPKSFVF